jgi:hypothetical protein
LATARRSRPDDTTATVNKALALLADGPIAVSVFKTKLQTKLHLSQHRAREIQAMVEATPGISKARSKDRFGGSFLIGPTDQMETAVAE